MRQINKFLAAIMAAVMVIAVALPAFASEEGDTTSPASRTIKITSPDGVAENVTNVYTIKKVFDASADASGHIRYTKMEGKSLPIMSADKDEKFDLDDGGNVVYFKLTDGVWVPNTTVTELSEKMIAAIAKYVAGDGAKYSVEITGPNTSGTVENVEYGYYYISTTTGSVVTIDSTTPYADVIDKNEMTTVVKSAGGTQYDATSMAAICQAGMPQNFVAEITLGKGATKLQFVDTMTNMTFNQDSLNIKVGEVAVEENNYTVTPYSNGASFTVDFKDDYIHTLDVGTVITLTYTGTVDSAALSVNPATNSATVKFGEGHKNHSDTDEVKVYNAKLTVTKKDGSDDSPLAGAGFVIKKAGGKYYKLTTDGGKDVVSWVDNIADADEHPSDAAGNVQAFTGLGVGVYTLVENTVPAGYNKAADETFEIKDGDYSATNLEQPMSVENNKGTELPSTGGIGTTIFYIVGGVMVAGSIIYLLAKRRMGVEE